MAKEDNDYARALINCPFTQVFANRRHTPPKFIYRKKPMKTFQFEGEAKVTVNISLEATSEEAAREMLTNILPCDWACDEVDGDIKITTEEGKAEVETT